MSWSVSLIGTPEKVIEALSKQSENSSGQTKVEFDSVLPGLIRLAQQNFETTGTPVVIQIEGSGHGTAVGDAQLSRYCSVSVKRIYGLLV